MGTLQGPLWSGLYIIPNSFLPHSLCTCCLRGWNPPSHSTLAWLFPSPPSGLCLNVICSERFNLNSSSQINSSPTVFPPTSALNLLVSWFYRNWTVVTLPVYLYILYIFSVSHVSWGWEHIWLWSVSPQHLQQNLVQSRYSMNELTMFTVLLPILTDRCSPGSCNKEWEPGRRGTGSQRHYS